MQPGIFRPVAMERPSSPDQLDRLMRITGPRTWIALTALGALTLSVLLWTVFGSIPTIVAAQGVVIRSGGTYNVGSSSVGNVSEVFVQRGDVLRGGQQIARVRLADGTTAQINNPFRLARVTEVLVSQEDPIGTDATVVGVELLDEEIVGLFYLPASLAAQVRPGMEVRMVPSSAKRQESGFMLGRVRSVAQFPSTRRGLTALLQNDSLVDLFRSSTGGAPVEVQVELLRDEDRWRRMQFAGRSLVENCFSLERVGPRIRARYRQFLEEAA